MRPRANAGFTLLEVMIAITLLALMMVAAYGTTSTTMKTKKKFERIQRRYREVRIAMNRIVRDLESAYISGSENRNLVETRTFFVGKSSGDVDELRFSAFAHVPLYAEANESDQTIIAYFGESDREKRSQENLMRRELKRPGNERYDTLPAEVNVLLTNVTKFELEYYDAKKRDWQDGWDTQNTDGQAPRVPDRVRITVGFKNEKNKEVVLVTQARVHMQETVQGYAN